MADDSLPQFEHGGVGGDDVDGPLDLLELTHERFIVALELDRIRREPRVLESCGHVGGAVAGDDHALELSAHVGEALKGGVVDPGDVGAVSPAVVETDHQNKALRNGLQKFQHLVAACRVFDEHHLGPALAEGEVLHAPEAALEVGQGGDGGLDGDAHLGRGRDGAHGVINIIQRREVDLRKAALAAHIEDDAAARGAQHGDIRHGIVGIAAVIAALGTAEAAQMPVADVVVLILRLAADAVARVRELRLFPFGGGGAEDPDPEPQPETKEYEDTDVWTGDIAISWNPEEYAGAELDTYNVRQDMLAGVAKDDSIKIYYAEAIEGAQFALTYKAGESWSWTDLAISQHSGFYAYKVASNEIAQDIADHGLVIRGQGYHATRIVIGKPKSATGFETTNASAVQSGSKILRNGQVLIIRDSKVYNMLGQLVD